MQRKVNPNQILRQENYQSPVGGLTGKMKMPRNERTSKRVAKIASKLLRDPNTPKKVKSVAGSVLTQAPDRKKTRSRKIK